MASPPSESSPRPPTVLVVDDLPINRLILKNMCSKLGFNVLEAADGYQCLKEFAAHAPEVCAVLMDLKMPHLSGWEAAFQLRALENLHNSHHNCLEPAGNCLDHQMCDESVEDSKCITTPVMPGTTNTITDQLTLSSHISSHLSTHLASADACIITGGVGLTGRRRVPIIACTATNPQESMSWCITSRGVPHMQPYTYPCSMPPSTQPCSVPCTQLCMHAFMQPGKQQSMQTCVQPPRTQPCSVPCKQPRGLPAYAELTHNSCGVDGRAACSIGLQEKHAWSSTAPVTPLSSSPQTFTLASHKAHSHAACGQQDRHHMAVSQLSTHLSAPQPTLQPSTPRLSTSQLSTAELSATPQLSTPQLSTPRLSTPQLSSAANCEAVADCNCVLQLDALSLPDEPAAQPPPSAVSADDRPSVTATAQPTPLDVCTPRQCPPAGTLNVACQFAQPPPSISSADVDLRSPADASMLDDGPCTCGRDTDTWCTSTVAQAARFAGIDQVLVKPMRMSVLEATLDTWLPGWRHLVKQRAAAGARQSACCTPGLRQTLNCGTSTHC